MAGVRASNPDRNFACSFAIIRGVRPVCVCRPFAQSTKDGNRSRAPRALSDQSRVRTGSWHKRCKRCASVLAPVEMLGKEHVTRRTRTDFILPSVDKRRATDSNVASREHGRRSSALACEAARLQVGRSRARQPLFFKASSLASSIRCASNVRLRALAIDWRDVSMSTIKWTTSGALVGSCPSPSDNFADLEYAIFRSPNDCDCSD